VCTSTFYLQEELIVFIAMLEYYTLSIKQGDEIEKKKKRKKKKLVKKS
jgi:hypothetical protein